MTYVLVTRKIDLNSCEGPTSTSLASAAWVQEFSRMFQAA